MKIALLSGGFPPDFDAIGEYTWWMSQELVHLGHDVTVFTSEGPTRTPPNGVKVQTVFSPQQPQTIERLTEAIGAVKPDWLIVQFNPFGFGPRGRNPHLNPALRQLKEKYRVRIAVMFHETCVPIWPWKFTVMRLWQYPMLVGLSKLAEVGFVSTTRWIPEVRRACRSLPVTHLPVGSNMPLCNASKAEVRAQLKLDPSQLIIGIFGSAHISRLMDWMGEAAQAIHRDNPNSLVLYVGKDGETFRNLCHGVPFIDNGPLPAEEASVCLRAMDLLLSPFTDGLSTRRGSAIAAFQHDVPVCSTRREWTDATFEQFPKELVPLSSHEDKATFIQNAVQLARYVPGHQAETKKLGELYERIFSWQTVARDTIKVLENTR